MGLQEERVILVFAAKVHDHAALDSDLRVKTEAREGLLHPLGGSGGIAGWGINRQQSSGLLPGVVGVGNGGAVSSGGEGLLPGVISIFTVKHVKLSFLRFG